MAKNDPVNREAWQLPPSARSVPQAREHIVTTLRRWHLEQLTDTARLLTSELVTNAVLHAHTPMTLAMESTDTGVRVSVSDGSPIPPALRRHSLTATTGRGLRLLDQLSDAWSVDDSNGGKTVWFTLSSGDNSKRAAAQRLSEVEA